ncbi:MAG: prolipoprotein diacylglyceryl transferase [Elusimicrobia bacterium]|nr:prolipoprotein diacylglyceryl transferase [Elusimicrobiota bacterium]
MFPTLLRIGEFRLATYGVVVAAGYLLGIWWLTRQREKMGLTEDDFWSLVYWLFAGALIGGKLLYLAVEWRALFDGTLHPLRDIRYGFVFYGGVLGSMAFGTFWCRRRSQSFAKFADYFAVALPLGHAVGRLACLTSGCCVGRPTSLPWAIRFTHPEALVDPALLGVPLHPVQAYESAADLAVTALALKVLGWVDAGKLRHGAGWAAYLAAYGVARFVLESFRGDDRGQGLLGLSPARALAIATTFGAVIYLARSRRAAA